MKLLIGIALGILLGIATNLVSNLLAPHGEKQKKFVLLEFIPNLVNSNLVDKFLQPEFLDVGIHNYPTQNCFP